MVKGTNRVAHDAAGNRFAALDSLRGIAALTVAGCHLNFGGSLFDSSYFRSGATAVDFFFVLSGFVIAASYGDRLAKGFAFWRFMFLRLGRLYPLLLALLAVYVLMETVQYVLALPGMVLREPFADSHSPAKLLLSLLLLQGFDDPAGNGWLIQSWSISVEIWLYVLAACAWRWLGAKAWIAALLVAIAAICALGVPEGGQSAVPLSSNLLRGLAGFGLGIACWRLREPRPRALVRGHVATAAECGALVLAYCAMTGMLSVGPFQAELNAAFAVMVLVFSYDAGALSGLLKRRAFFWLGTLSYSIYLTHLLVIARGFDLLRLLGWGEMTLEDGSVERQIAGASPLVASSVGIALLAATVVLSYFTWRWIEYPARQWSRRRMRDRDRP